MIGSGRIPRIPPWPTTGQWVHIRRHALHRPLSTKEPLPTLLCPKMDSSRQAKMSDTEKSSHRGSLALEDQTEKSDVDRPTPDNGRDIQQLDDAAGKDEGDTQEKKEKSGGLKDYIVSQQWAEPT